MGASRSGPTQQPATELGVKLPRNHAAQGAAGGVGPVCLREKNEERNDNATDKWVPHGRAQSARAKAGRSNGSTGPKWGVVAQ